MKITGLSLLAALSGALSLPAADGRIPIAAAPATLAQAGSYYLTRDLTSAGTPITISATGVTLDLAGHTVTSTSVTAGVAVIAAADAATDLEISGGRVSGGPIGIQIGINGATGNIRLHDLQLAGQTALGVNIPSASNPSRNVAIERVQIALTSGGGVVCNNCEGLLIRDAVIYATGAPANSGISTSGTGALITDNGIRGFIQGILLTSEYGGIVARNTVSGAVQRGIFLIGSSRNQVRDNQVVNVAAGGAGLDVRGDQNTLDGNSLMNDGAYGLTIPVGTANVYGNNRSQGNTASNYFPGVGNIDAGGNF